MESVVTRSALHDAADGKSVSVMNENHRNASREVTLEGDVVHAVRMHIRAHQGTDVHDIDESYLEIRKVLPKQPHCRYGLGRRYITCAGKHYIRFSGIIITGKSPNTDPAGTVFARLTHR